MLLLLVASAQAVDVASSKRKSCHSVDLYRELSVYKDPSLFLPTVARLLADPNRAWKELREQDPLLTKLQGRVDLIEVDDPIPFRGFVSLAALTVLYGRVEPKLDLFNKKGADNTQIQLVQLCRNDAYADTLGFVVVEDFKLAKTPRPESGSGSLPPYYVP